MTKRGRKREAKVEAVTADRLKSFVDRIVRLIEEREGISGDIGDVFTEAKSIGYDVATMRKVIKLYRMDAADRAEEESLLETYMHALGLVDRVQNRVAAGETLDSAAKAEGITKSRAHRIVSKAQSNQETEQIAERPIEAIAADILAMEVRQANAAIVVVEALVDTYDPGPIPPHLDRRKAVPA